MVDAAAQRIYASNGGNIGVKYYLTQLGNGKFALERALDNLWDDIPGLGTTPVEDVGYPTQKTAALLERIIRTATDPGDLVLDCFMGSGTTLAVAQQLGRRWIGCDNSRGALLTARRRLQAQMLAANQVAPGFAVYQMPQTTTLHQSASQAQAKVQIMRNPQNGAQIQIEISDYQSATLATLLAQAKPDRQRVEEWRALIDCVAIDPAYNGHLFQSRLVDAPLKKSAQVKGFYTLPAPAPPTWVAVRLTDLLGEEVLVTQCV